jgi:hypothetical protein
MYLVSSRDQMSLGVIAIFIGGGREDDVAVEIADSNGGVADHRAGGVRHNAHDAAINRLRRQLRRTNGTACQGYSEKERS